MIIKSKVKLTLCQRASRLCRFAVPYNFSISHTCGFAFRHAGTCFHALISTIWHFF